LSVSKSSRKNSISRRHALNMGLSTLAVAGAGGAYFAMTQSSHAQSATADIMKIDPKNDNITGSMDAPVTLVEYSSMTCPHCAQFHTTVLPTIKSEFIDKGHVRLVFRDFPLDNLALTASVVARCAGPDRYFPFLNALFASQDKWARDRNPVAALSRIARLGGMSQADFDSCLKKKEVAEKVLAQRLEADKAYGVRSTPTIIVNGDLYGGGLGIDQLRAVINSKLK